MKLRKSTGRYGPHRTCAQCGIHTDKLYISTNKVVLCSSECLNRWADAQEEKAETLHKHTEGYRRERDELAHWKEQHINSIRELEQIVNSQYKLVDKVHALINKADVPSGGNILERLEYLIEQHLLYKRHVPRASLMEWD